MKNVEFIDIHYHASPDLFQRRYSVMEAGKLYQNLNGAVFLKSHLGPTAVQATLAQQSGLPVFPSLVLNDIAGGIHYKSILRTLAEYQPLIPSKMIVHLPTITGREHPSKLVRRASRPEWYPHLTRPACIINSDGRFNDGVIDYPIVLSTGHASKDEVYALIDACIQYQVPALLLNQPANPMTGLTAANLMEIAEVSFVWTEQTALTYLLSYQDETDFERVLKHVPRVIYSSDLGQTTQMDVPEWLEQSNQWFTKFNLLPQLRKDLCLNNPLNLLLM
jgi:hypothetical protein